MPGYDITYLKGYAITYLKVYAITCLKDHLPPVPRVDAQIKIATVSSCTNICPILHFAIKKIDFNKIKNKNKNFDIEISCFKFLNIQLFSR